MKIVRGRATALVFPFYRIVYRTVSLRMVRGVSALILLGASAYASAADAPPLSSYEIPRINLAPRIDGKVDAAEWREAKRVVIDIETDPAEIGITFDQRHA